MQNQIVLLLRQQHDVGLHCLLFHYCIAIPNSQFKNICYNCFKFYQFLTLLHSERTKLRTILAFLGAMGLKFQDFRCLEFQYLKTGFGLQVLFSLNVTKEGKINDKMVLNEKEKSLYFTYANKVYL